MKKISLFLLALTLLLAGMAGAQEIGDYRSVATGNWRAYATWETWDGGSWITPVVYPKSGNNVLIRSGHTITFSTSPDTCKNLIVESGALLYNNNTTNRYLIVFGDSVRNDGSIGGPTDGICFTCMTSVTFKGNGSYQISRLRPGASNVTITIDRNFEVHYTAAAPNNVALYANSQTGCTIQVNDGDTLTFSSNSAFSWGTNSTTASSVGGTFFIDGTVIMPSGSNFNISVANGLSSLVHIYGNLVLGDTLIADAATSGDETVVVHGAISYSSPDTQKFDNLYTNNPSGTSFGFPVRVNEILYIGYGDYDNSSGLSLGYGSHIYRYVGALTTAPDFDQWINLNYGPNPENLPLTTGHEVPMADSINEISFDNSAGVVLDQDISCYGSVVFEEGIVNADSHMLSCYNQPTRTSGYLADGLLGIWIPTGYPTVSFHVGTANGYSPATVYFQNVNTAGGLGVGVGQSTQPDVNIAANTMQRYWNIGQHQVTPVIFDSCRIYFTYLPADFNTGFTEAEDEGAMLVGKYDDPNWTFPDIDTRTPGGVDDGGTIGVANVTSFSEFTIGKDQDAIYTFVDTIAPYITGIYPAWGAIDVGLNDTIVIAFSEPMNADSLDGYTYPFHDFTPSWNAAGDTFTLAPQDPYPYSTLMSVIITSGIDLAGNSLEFLPDTVVQFTSSPFKGPEITLVQQPGDTYDGSGPFLVRAVITDLGKAGIAADTLWYTDNATDWWAVVHSSTDGDTFNYNIPGPLAAGTVIEFFFGAWDDGGTVQYDPSMYRGYQFRILSPLAPNGLAANGGNLTVDLSWTPPAQVLSYYLTNNTGFFQDAGNIVDTRFTPQHYPCKLEQAVSSWWYAAGNDSVELHVWADDGDGLPDRSVELVPPVTIMPLDYPAYTVVDLSAHNLILSAGDFHIGYIIRTDNMPMPLSDGDGPGIRSLVYDSSAAAWGNMISGGTTYHDWSHEAAVTYHDYSKGLALKSYIPKTDSKPLAVLTNLKPIQIVNKQPAVYPDIKGALFLAKNIAGYDLLRSNVSGGPYTGLSKVNDTTYTDTTVLNNNTYYYVVRAVYASPDTFSEYSNEASATPTGVEGRPEVRAHVLQLQSAAPNPMTSRTAIRFSLPASAQASLEVFNVLGQKVATLASGKLEAGYHTVNWDGTDRHGAKLASGVYIYQLRTMSKTLTKRMTILR